MRLRRREEEEKEREGCTLHSCELPQFDLRTAVVGGECLRKKKIRGREGRATATTVIDASSTVNSLEGAVPQRVDDNSHGFLTA